MLMRGADNVMVIGVAVGGAGVVAGGMTMSGGYGHRSGSGSGWCGCRRNDNVRWVWS